MRTLNQKLKRIAGALTAVSKNVYHYRRPADLTGAVIWQEDAEDGSFHAGNHLAEQTIHGTVDYFTKTEFDKTVDDIQASLEQFGGIAWALASVQYEDDTKLIHYEWYFWVA